MTDTRFQKYDPTKVAGKLLLSVDGERLLRERYGVISMRREGDELVMDCPLTFGLHDHGGRSKFALNPRKNVCNCWVCGGGNILWLIKHCERDEDGNPREVSDSEALAIAKQYARSLTDEEYAELIREGMSEHEAEPPSKVSYYYEGQIKEWAKNKHPYWAKRGFNIETVEMWQLGYNPKEDKVVVPHKFGRQYVGFQKRPIVWKREYGPKWQCSDGFPRKDSIFNYDQAVKYDSVVVVEAPISAIYLWQCGIPNVVSTFGSMVTDEQIRLLRRFSDVIIWLDPDKAGWKGTQTLLEGLRGHADTWVVNNNQGDPNEVADGKLREPEDVWNQVYKNGLVPGFLWKGGE